MRCADCFSFKGFGQCKPTNGSMSHLVIWYRDLFKDTGSVGTGSKKKWKRLFDRGIQIDAEL